MELTTTKVTTLVLDKKTAKSLLLSLKTFINEEDEEDLIFLASGFVGDKSPVLLEIYLDSASSGEEEEEVESVITD